MSDPRTDALAYLASHHVMTLATTGPAGPWAAAVFYVNDGFTLTFLSSPGTRHATDLAANRRCGAAIHEDYSDWTTIKGIQLEGVVRQLTGTDRLSAIARYAKKFDIVRPDRAPELIKAALDRVAWYELVPDHCYLIDNAAGFGKRVEVALKRSSLDEEAARLHLEPG